MKSIRITALTLFILNLALSQCFSSFSILTGTGFIVIAAIATFIDPKMDVSYQPEPDENPEKKKDGPI